MSRARVFNIAQYEKNPVTGEDLHFSEQTIIKGLDHKSIRRWAYIRHDNDVYTEEDVKRMKEDYDIDVVEGDLRPPHWHVVLDCPGNVDVLAVAKWFGIPEGMIHLPKGRGSFLDCVAYLTHESDKQQALGKRLYADECVKANFEWRQAVIELMERRAEYGVYIDDKDFYRSEVLYKGMTLREVAQKAPIAYQNDYGTLDKLRLKYINNMKPPRTRMNYYIDGNGGLGKGIMARALARSLYPTFDGTLENPEDDDIFFSVGSRGAAFEGYDGQPVIIWHDRRAEDLLNELNGRGNVFNVFDTHPDKGRQNVKYSSVNLINTVNIIEGIEPYKHFINVLAGTEDKNQVYRRIPFIINVHEEDFDLLINKGCLEGTFEYERYLEYNHIRGSMKRIADMCGNNERLARELEHETVKVVVDKHSEVMNSIEKPAMDEDAIRAMFADVGTIDENANLMDIAREEWEAWEQLQAELKEIEEEENRKRVAEIIQEENEKRQAQWQEQQKAMPAQPSPLTYPVNLATT